MECLRCGTEMKHYEWINQNTVYGKEHKQNQFSLAQQIPHNPHSIYECEKCGYCELSTKICREPDL